MYPMWLTSVNDRMRFSSAWARAPRMPTIIVASAAISSSRLRSLSRNSCDSVRIIA